MGLTFVDTNVLVYLFDQRDRDKHERAVAVLKSLPAESIVLSTQVLMELYAVLTRKLTPSMPPNVALGIIERWARYRVVTTDAPLVLAGLRLGTSHQLSSWDGLILAAAAAAGCDRVLTEDLQDGATYDGLIVVNPFTNAGADG